MARSIICNACEFDEKSRRADPFSNVRVVRLPPHLPIPIGQGGSPKGVI
jgi:hypothetical protein